MTIAFQPFLSTVRYKLQTARRLAAETASLRRNEGLRSSARHLAAIAKRLLRWYHPARVWRRHRTNEFDRCYGVDTSGFVHPSQFAAVAGEGADPHHYKAIRPEDFHAAISSLAIRHEEFEFVDYGSGKGRALLLASDYPFRRIAGIEFSPELHQTALRNMVRYRSPRQLCFGIRSICADAATFDLPEVPCVPFFYDPFGERLMSAVLDRIGDSLARCPRELFIVYCQPRLRELMSQRRFLGLAVEGEHFAIFKAARGGEIRVVAGAGEVLSTPGHR
jgi:SAM-dependent methyltransferase